MKDCLFPFGCQWLRIAVDENAILGQVMTLESFDESNDDVHLLRRPRGSCVTGLILVQISYLCLHSDQCVALVCALSAFSTAVGRFDQL